MDDTQITYLDAGVDIEAGADAVKLIAPLLHSTYRDGVIGDVGGFGGMFSIEDAREMEGPILVAGTDGVGTKIELARRFNIHDTVGIDLVAMCANDILCCGARPLFFLDYIACGRLIPKKISEIVRGIADGCIQAQCALIGGETAEHPGVMDDEAYDLSGFCVGLAQRDKLLGKDRVCEGDLLIGLASSGLHSNGYSLVRRAITDALDDDELNVPLPGLESPSLIDALLVPTRIYVKTVLGLIGSQPGCIHAIAHITGGGITENLNRILPYGLNAEVYLQSWPALPIIDYVCNAAQLSQEEAYKTFNMGIGMVLVIDAAQEQGVMSFLGSAGEKAYVIGKIAAASGQDDAQKVVYRAR